ncbi:MAG: SDR family oxidoreductase, partial [Actinobacteria bacterium]|nr:SDR family oxidoreductase [Actinomycetota bacterium]
DTAAAVVREIEAAGGRAAVAAGSVAEPAQADAIVAAVEEAFGTLDILVNNAGLTRDAAIHRMTDEQWGVVQDVVLRGTFGMCRAAARLLRAKDAAHHRKVVNVASVAGVYGAAGTTNYSAAKGGVIGLTKALAREWAPLRINVNAVAPGLITQTRLADGMPDGLLEKMVGMTPIGRGGVPEDVAAAVSFLASPDADYMTGQVIELHGGLELIPSL